MNFCKNCRTELRGPFCMQCGQKAKVERITFAYFWSEIFYFFTHIKSGFLFTSLSMLVHPGKSVMEFIEGKRVKYQSPVSYFLIWTTIFVLVLYAFETFFGQNVIIDYQNYFGPFALTQYAISHLSFILTVIIPFQAFYLYIFLSGGKVNYMESLVAAVYAIGTVILLQFVFSVLAFMVYLITRTSTGLAYSDVFKVAYLSKFTVDLVIVMDVRQKVLRALAFLLFAFATFTLWRVYGVPEITSWILGK